MRQNSRSNKRKIRHTAAHWKRSYILIAGLALLIAGIFTVNVVRTSTFNPASPDNPLAPQTVHISMSTRSYPTFKALTQRASLIVMGHVVGNGTTKRVAQPNSASNSSIPDQSRPETTFSFQITRVFKGSVPANHQISIFQTGGTVSERLGSGAIVQRTYVVDDQPLLLAGNEVILFLDRADTPPDTGAYYIIGGQEGRFTVSQGQVHPFLSYTKRLVGHDGDTLKAFATAIAEAEK